VGIDKESMSQQIWSVQNSVEN